MSYFGPMPTTTNAYAKDSGDEYFGEAARGATVSHAKWMIFKMEYSGDNWLIVFPVDTSTNKASAEPKFIWDDVLTYTYRELGT